MPVLVNLAKLMICPGYLLRLATIWCCYFISIHSACLNWVTVSNRCHKVFINSSGFVDISDARARCGAEGADLATFNDYAEQTSLTAHIRDTNGTYKDVYIGAMDTNNDGNHTWLDGTTVTYSNFTAPYDSSNIRHVADRCVTLRTNDNSWSDASVKWERVACCFKREITAVACTKPAAGPIITGNQTSEICNGNCSASDRKLEGMCYKVVTGSPISAYYARRACLDVGYDIANIPRGIIFDHVTNMLSDLSLTSNRKIYTGINNLTASSDFVNADGTTYTESDLITVNTCSYDGNSQKCMTLTSSSSTWNNVTTQYCPDNCCANLGITHILCEKPESGPANAVSPDDDNFAAACYAGIDECGSNPCINGGTCQDKILAYNCSCSRNYTGVNCEKKIDFCTSGPCRFGQNCTSGASSYFCDCDAAYTGDNCETVLDQCVSDPCLHGAACVDGPNSYTCNCIEGYEGVNCQTDIDECLNKTCQNNGTCLNQIGVATCQCPPKYTGSECETTIYCLPKDPVVENSTSYRVGSNEAGDTIVFTCLDGLRMRDRSANRTLTCLSTEQWSFSVEEMGNCEYHCDELPSLVNGYIANLSSEVGKTVDFVCNEGFLFPDNTTSFNITCLDIGKWTIAPEDIPNCEIVKCPTLPDWNYQTVDTTNHTYNTTVTFWCDVGYELHDTTIARTIWCTSTGEWTVPLPPCNAVRCPKLDIPASYNIKRDSDDNTYGALVTYECDDGKRMLDGATSRTIKCDATKEWSDNITDCISNRCFPLPFVANATPESLDANFGDVSRLHCIKGHRFDGKYKTMKMTCKDDGWWHPILHSCEPIYCPVLNDVLNAVKSTQSRLYATRVNFTCVKGHYYYPNMTSVVSTECDDSQYWTVTEFEPCWPIVCDMPPDITNGTRVLPANNVFNYSSQVFYECISGFKFIDGDTYRTIECDVNGNWNLTDVSCRVDRCSKVPTAANVWPDTTNTSWYTNVTYRCDIGHEWPNDRSTYHITCLNDGKWNDTEVPECTIKVCTPVSTMANATTNTTTHVYNTFVEYECNKGFKYHDNETKKVRWCSDMAVWEPEEFDECEIIYCPELFDVENATRDSNDTYYNNHVTYSCLPGYQYPNKRKMMTIYCTENETWSYEPPPCEVVFCPPVPWWTETKFNSTLNEFNAEVSYYCNDGYVFEDSVNDPDAVKYSTCTHAKIWDPPIDDCLAKDSIAADLIGVTYDSPDAVSIGTVACALTCTILACLVLLDTHKLYSDLRVMKNNISSFVRDMKQRQGSRNKVSDSQTSIKSAVDSPP